MKRGYNIVEFLQIYFLRHCMEESATRIVDEVSHYEDLIHQIMKCIHSVKLCMIFLDHIAGKNSTYVDGAWRPH